MGGQKTNEPVGIFLQFQGASPEKYVAFFRYGQIAVVMSLEFETINFKPNEGVFEGKFRGKFTLFGEGHNVEEGVINSYFIPTAKLNGKPYTSKPK